MLYSMNTYILPKSDLQVLRNAHRRAKKKRDADRIKAVYLLGKGWKLIDVSEALLLDEDTLRNYAKKYRKGKIPLLLNDDYQAYEGKLTTEEIELLDAHLQEVTYRRAIDIVDYIQEEFDESFSLRGVTMLLERLGYTYKKPRKVPGKANAEEQKKFVQAYRKLRHNMQREDTLLFMDGVHPQHNPLVMKGWIKRGEEKQIRTNTRYHRLNINGAVDIDTHEIFTQMSPKLNEESTLDFLEMLRKKRPYGIIYLVLDNAGYYNTQRVKAFAKACAIELIYLPPYSPNLNVIERIWLYFQKNILYNTYYPSFEKFKDACINFFRPRSQRKYRSELASLLTENFEIISV